MKTIQYTIRDVPHTCDRALRSRSKAEGRSLNAVVLDALIVGLGLTGESPEHFDLDKFIGSWVDDPAVEAALNEMDAVDAELWS